MGKGSEFVCNHVTKADDEYDYLLFVFKENIKYVPKKQVKYEVHKSIRFIGFVKLSKSFSSKKQFDFVFISDRKYCSYGRISKLRYQIM